MEEKFLGHGKRLIETNERLVALEKQRSTDQAGVQREGSDERATPATEAGGEEISQPEQQFHLERRHQWRRRRSRCRYSIDHYKRRPSRRINSKHCLSLPQYRSCQQKTSKPFSFQDWILTPTPFEYKIKEPRPHQ